MRMCLTCKRDRGSVGTVSCGSQVVCLTCSSVNVFLKNAVIKVGWQNTRHFVQPLEHRFSLLCYTKPLGVSFSPHRNQTVDQLAQDFSLPERCDHTPTHKAWKIWVVFVIYLLDYKLISGKLLSCTETHIITCKIKFLIFSCFFRIALTCQAQKWETETELIMPTPMHPMVSQFPFWFWFY